VSNLANVVGAVIGLAAINKLLDRNDTTIPGVAPKPLIKEGFVTGPAAGVQDFTLISESFGFEKTLQPKPRVSVGVREPKPLVPDFGKVETAISKLDFVKPDISKLPKAMPRPLEFTPSYFTDPAVQARLRAKQ